MIFFEISGTGATVLLELAHIGEEYSPCPVLHRVEDQKIVVVAPDRVRIEAEVVALRQPGRGNLAR